MKILIVDKLHPSILPSLHDIGFEVDYLPDIDNAAIPDIIHRYEGIILRNKLEIDKTILKKGGKLKFIARAGAGMDLIDVQAAKKRNIHLINAPEGNKDSLAEHTIGMLLALLNKMLLSDKEVRSRVWNRESNRGIELKGKTVCIIGYGNMGKAFAKRLSAFDCKVLTYDKYLKNYTDKYAKEASMEEVFEKTDIISFHVPLTEETRQMVNNAYLGSFKRSFWLINTARGEILRSKALVQAIREGKVKGAALDVLENENLEELTEDEKKSFNYLAGSDKVLMTPHTGGLTYESYERINEVLVGKIRALRIAPPTGGAN
ncbi:MAG: phosphoglycerate dehydrogenase [Bacteroidetes bacterium]|nr:phosphoglycerate dehydrogenase [Bacteroidota bacterium]